MPSIITIGLFICLLHSAFSFMTRVYKSFCVVHKPRRTLLRATLISLQRYILIMGLVFHQKTSVYKFSLTGQSYIVIYGLKNPVNCHISDKSSLVFLFSENSMRSSVKFTLFYPWRYFPGELPSYLGVKPCMI